MAMIEPKLTEVDEVNPFDFDLHTAQATAGVPELDVPAFSSSDFVLNTSKIESLFDEHEASLNILELSTLCEPDGSAELDSNSPSNSVEEHFDNSPDVTDVRLRLSFAEAANEVPRSFVCSVLKGLTGADRFILSIRNGVYQPATTTF
jgi:hypothetical protein